jgi:hypothetical protein
MFRRPTIRSTVTTLAAAAVLVGGADLASYAATGNPLILGHANSAGGTTSLKNTGRGPALSLNSIKSAPPLVVNSSQLVKHLNADTVHGVPASVVAPRNYQITLDKAGKTFANTRVVTSTVPPGTYQITLSGAIVPSVDTSVQCFFGDKKFVTASTPDVSDVYAATFEADGTTAGVTINAVGTATVRKHHKVFEACIAGSSNSVLLPLVANLTRVNGVVKRPATVFHPAPRTAKLLGR